MLTFLMTNQKPSSYLPAVIEGARHELEKETMVTLSPTYDAALLPGKARPAAILLCWHFIGRCLKADGMTMSSRYG